MTVRALGTRFASSLHAERFKRLGFKKTGSTCSRARDGYVESINIQGSDWNSGDEPWLFYVNIRVQCLGLPDLPNAQRRYHADGRLSSIVAESPGRFELTSSNLGELVTEVGGLCEAACEALPALLAPIRARAERGLYSFIPLPDTWSD